MRFNAIIVGWLFMCDIILLNIEHFSSFNQETTRETFNINMLDNEKQTLYE